MSMLVKLRFAFQQIEHRVLQALGASGPLGPHSPALAYDVAHQPETRTPHQCLPEPQPRDFNGLLDSIFGNGILWAAVPKSRVSRERRWLRKNSRDRIKKFATPKKNLVSCLECGHWHESHTLCGNCYQKVRKETELMQDTMGSDALKYNAPQTEVVYLYEEEKDDRPKYKGKYIVEMEKKKPNWWPAHLLTKARGQFQ